MVKFVGTDGNTSKDAENITRVCPAQIVGFFKYKSWGIPTPSLVEQEGWNFDACHSNLLGDDCLYAVVHMASDYVSWERERMKAEFVVPFQLGDAKS